MPHYNPGVIHHDFSNEYIVIRTPTELYYFESSGFSEDFQRQDELSFEIGVGEWTYLQTHDIVAFEHRDELGNEELIHDSFYRSAITFTKGKFGTETYSDAGIILDKENEKHS